MKVVSCNIINSIPDLRLISPTLPILTNKSKSIDFSNHENFFNRIVVIE